MTTDNFQIYQLALAVRVITAGICGVIIGLERLTRSKSAGVRTHCIVAVGAALMMVISKYGFSDTISGEMGMRGADGARIAAQVVSGIGFLGAGMIFVHKNSITGLTTAAGIWATAGIGMAIGAGLYVLGFVTMLTIVAAQILLHRNFRWLQMPKSKALYISDVDAADYQIHIKTMLSEIGATVSDVSVEKNKETETRNYKIVFEVPENINEDEIVDKISYNCKIKSLS
ncbi:MAG: MgtC/SapB family protein [Eubacteriales bacterium]|nr:MgtC/SapB family protein [Eubacteriales bacterium]MDY4213116.1 MgtC/SapB family protein [Eubacteriales bacterium]MDY5231458.1 MgtC/SapB family protein [Eubacteriales bacterium]